MISNRSLTLGLLLSAFGSTQAQKSTGTVDLLLLTGAKAPEQLPTGTVSEVDGTRTIYQLHCTPFVKTVSDVVSIVDPCPLIGGAVTAEPTKWEYDIYKATVNVIGRTVIGSYSSDGYSEDLFATGTVICDVASDKAECSGRLTSYRAVNGTTSFTATADITTTITGVSANLVPATITKGFEKLPPTSTSTGGASALVIQPALLIGGAAAILGGAFML